MHRALMMILQIRMLYKGGFLEFLCLIQPEILRIFFKKLVIVHHILPEHINFQNKISRIWKRKKDARRKWYVSVPLTFPAILFPVICSKLISFQTTRLKLDAWLIKARTKFNWKLKAMLCTLTCPMLNLYYS